MDFDPLSLFTPKDGGNLDQEDTILAPWLKSPLQYKENNDIVQEGDESNNDHHDEIIDDSDSHLVPIHILDLPLLKLQPPFGVLYTILRLLSLNEVWNFQQDEEDRDYPLMVFEDKLIDINIVHESLSWLENYCPRFNTILKLSCIPKLSFSLKKLPQYNDWLTRIIINDLSWLTDEEISIIHKETSLRISENCGRTAQPEIIRKIKLHNMSKLGVNYVKLKEPALTSDNLGLKTWGSSLILSQRLINDRQVLKEPILELGAGTGLVGIVLSCLGYNDIYLTDLPEIVPNLKENIKINDLHNLVIDELDWNDVSYFMEKYPIKFNTIILSDPIYSADHPALIFNVLNNLVNEDTEILLQVPLRRNYQDIRDNLWNLLNNKYKETYNNIEVGSDEFGDTTYCFKKFIPKCITN